MKKFITIALAVVLTAVTLLNAQSVGINTDGSDPDGSAMLDVKSTTSGFLAPRMTADQLNAISTPATGLLVYQTDGTPGYYYYNGSVWTQIGPASGASQWTTNSSNIYYNSGNVGIGTTAPYSKLEVHDKIIAGNQTSTEGSTLLENRYNQNTGDAINTLGTMYSSGAWLMGYAMRPKSVSSGYLSSADNVTWERSGMELGHNFFQLLYAPTQQTTVGDDITGLTTPFYVDLDDGNVGIGTTTPAKLLQVGGDVRGEVSIVGTDGSSPSLTLDHTATTNGRKYTLYSGGSSAGNFDIYDLTASATRLTISSVGNVGIGTITPDYELDVVGDVNITGDFKVNGVNISGGSGTLAIGDSYQGGIIFWLDATGQHGLVCAKEDQDGGSGIRWYAGTDGATRATGDGFFAGELNTAIIISSQVSIGDDGNDYAAQICNDLQITQNSIIYGDWYLPSIYELNLMYTNKSTINTTALENSGSSFASAYYWSSTEYDNYYAWEQNFGDGSQGYGGKNGTYRVRAVRAF
ncbi:MAG: DUF1566 domain-containing protein [Candidatus Delongbacteria bacterium]|nr:DUF1566 domain-containing protein [Candidatus Delongbacteria bacterium]